MRSASAFDISLNVPSPVKLNEEFITTVFLSETTQESYDVKIFVHDSEDSKVTKTEYISEIYNDETEAWSDPWYYLSAAFPQKGKYKIRVISSPGFRTICVRLRKSGSSSFTESCIPLEVTGSAAEEPQELPIENTSPEEKISQDSLDKKSINSSIQKEPSNIQPLAQRLPPEKIILNVPQSESFQSGPEKRSYLIYFFIAFAFFLIILLALRKL